MVAMQRRAWLAAFTMAVVLTVVTGCTGASARPNLSRASASTPSSAAVSATPTATPTPAYPADVPLTGHNVKPGEKPPSYPIAAAAKTQQGANAFAEFFMKTLDWAYATTNPSYMNHYYGASCGLCAGLATGITKTAAEGHWYEGGRLSITNVDATLIEEVSASTDFCSSVHLNINATTVVDSTGKIFNGQGALQNQSFKLCEYYLSSGWQISYLVGTT